jgi:hypothetical protein
MEEKKAGFYVDKETVWVLEIFNVHQTRDIHSLVTAMGEMLWVLNKLNHSMFEDKITIQPWQKNLEIQVFKFSTMCFTLGDISKGSDTILLHRTKVTKRYDITTLYISARALIELYLTIHYLNFDIGEPIQAQFRSDLYEWSGFIRRQEMYVNMNSKEALEQKESERLEYEALYRKINNNTYFLSLDKETRNRLIKTRQAREYKWETIIERRAIRKESFLKMWKLYSNHAHSEHIGNMQFNGSIMEPQKNPTMVFNTIIHTIFLVTFIIDDFRKAFPSANKVYEQIEYKIRHRIEYYYKIATAPEY